jgi:hypothetical protein
LIASASMKIRKREHKIIYDFEDISSAPSSTKQVNRLGNKVPVFFFPSKFEMQNY